jgi:hypothetical protein
VNGTAFRLAFQDHDGFKTSRFGYYAPEAANQAAPMLNRARAARGYEMYSHVIAYSGDRAVQVQELEQAA